MDIYNVANQMKLERKTIFDLKIRVTFYARVSTTREEQENSIENQIMYFTNMIQENPNWTYIEGYVDRIRGEKAENRVQFMQMIEDGKSGKFDLILTKEVSRFARDTIDSLTYTRDLLRAGIGVFFQNDNICTIDTDSELRLTIMSSIAADEVRKLSDRIRWGHKRSIESGNVLGNNRIFGYDLIDKKLYINEKEAEMVKLIFDLYATGKYSVRKIENILFDKGYRGRNDNRIHHNTISGIIQNPKYKGYYCGGKVKITDYRTKQQCFLPQEEWTMYKDKTGEIVPAIVNEEVWNKCNEIFNERSQIVKAKGHSIKDSSVFSGKILCAVHNKTFWRTSYSNSKQKGTPTYQWICGEKRRFGAKYCQSFAIIETELYQILDKYFLSITPHFSEYIQDFLEIYKQTNTVIKTDKHIKDLKLKLQREKSKQDKLLELYLDNSITKPDFQQKNAKLADNIQSLETDIKSLEKESDPIADIQSNLTQIEQVLKNAYSKNNMSKEMIDEMASELIQCIEVTPMDINTMQLNIVLKTGQSQKVKYVNQRKDHCCSGNIFLKMLPKQQWSFSRTYLGKNYAKYGCFVHFVVYATI